MNADPSSVETLQLSAIPLSTLQKKVAKLKAHQVIFIMDACRNDPEKGKGDGDNKLTEAFSKSLVVAARAQGPLAGGNAVLFACSEGERAFEDPVRGQSAFTYYLLEALRGKAAVGGALSMTDVADYVQRQVAEWARDHNKKQTPELKTEGAARIVLADRITAAASPAEPAPIRILDTQAALTITSDPPGADVTVDGKVVGTTPFTLTTDLGLIDKKTVRIGLSQDGYQTRVFDIDLTRGKTLSAPAIILSAIRVNPGVASAKFKKNAKDDADMVFIPAGEFKMGSNAGGDREKPVHKVTLDGYYIYRTPVTVAQYLKFCDETGHAKPEAPSFNPNWFKRDHPIVNVSYNDALAYCNWAGVKLPTEAQWEKAARGTDGREYPWGEKFDRSKLWCSESKFDDAGGTKPVGSFPSGKSPFGVLDMAGNVWQWCSDWFDENFYSSRTATERNPENQAVGEKKYRVVRGGSWGYYVPGNFRSAYRLDDGPDGRGDGIGFRCASGL